jgi:hypothetical protein
MASGTLKVEILTEGIHSGDASGLVPSSFRIMRQVLDRLEDSATGRLLPAELPLRGACRPAGPGASHRRHPGRRGVPALSVGALRLRRLHHLCAAHHHRPGAGPAQAHLGAHAERDRRRGLSGAAGRGQRAAPLHRLQAQPAPAAAGGCRPGRARAQSPARRQRALPGQGHLREPERRHGLERPGHHALVRAGAQRSLAGALWRALRLHRPGRHHPADEHAQRRLPQGADDGVRRAGPQEQRPRPQRVPARALRQAPHRLGGACDGPTVPAPFRGGRPRRRRRWR